MSRYPTYPNYKTSTIDWLGDIPEHWELKKIKYLFRIKKDIAGKLGYDVLSITQKGIKVKNIESGEGQLAMDYSKYQLVKKGDFAMNHMDLLTGYVDISKYDGVLSPDYRAFSLTHKESNPRYYLYLLQFCYTNRIFFNYGQGSSQLGRWRLAADEFNNFFYPCPSFSEQTQIANFLDHKCRLIDKFLDKKQQLIDVLKEQKQAVINQAVTKGLDPNVEMKDSGVEWLGEIPAHWSISKLKWRIRIKSGDMISSQLESVDGVYPIYGGNGIRGYSNHFNTTGDRLLIGRVGAKCGNVHRVKNKYWVSEHAYRVNLSRRDNIDFIKYVIEVLNLTQYAITTAQPLLNSTIVYNQLVPIPKKGDQDQIVDHIAKETSQIDQAISRIEKEMELVKDYRQILISEAVTGKIDVRKWRSNKEPEDQISMAAEPAADYQVKHNGIGA